MHQSRLFRYLNPSLELSLIFLEGEELIRDLALRSHFHKQNFHFMRDQTLAFIPLIYLLKNGETLGLYVEGENPTFQYKQEINSNGYFRHLLLPREGINFPENFTGNIRLTKLSPQNKNPYNSILAIKNLKATEMVNQIFNQSYQIASVIKISNTVDRSVLMVKLPGNISNSDFKKQCKDLLEGPLSKFLKNKHFDDQEFKSLMENNSFYEIASTPLKFHCGCSFERMQRGLLSLGKEELESIFKEQEIIETVCEYCDSVYKFKPDDLNSKG